MKFAPGNDVWEKILMSDFEKWFANYKKQRMRKDRTAGALILIGGGLYILFCILSFACALITGHTMPLR